MENSLKTENLLPTILDQKWITLQYLYRKLGDNVSAERIINHYGSEYKRLQELENITKKILSGKCTGLTEEADTCFYWNMCLTCDLTGRYGICGYCMMNCHKNHITFFEKVITSKSYCDCKEHNRERKEDKEVNYFLNILNHFKTYIFL